MDIEVDYEVISEENSKADSNEEETESETESESLGSREREVAGVSSESERSYSSSVPDSFVAGKF
jgi:hypothetical protein